MQFIRIKYMGKKIIAGENMNFYCEFLTIALDSEENNYIYASGAPGKSSPITVYVTHKLVDEAGQELSAHVQYSATVSLANYNCPCITTIEPTCEWQGHWNIAVSDKFLNSDGSLTTVLKVEYTPPASWGQHMCPYPISMKFAAVVTARNDNVTYQFSSAAFGQPGDVVVSMQHNNSLPGRSVTVIYKPHPYYSSD